jgi:hypothetical protein
MFLVYCTRYGTSVSVTGCDCNILARHVTEVMERATEVECGMWVIARCACNRPGALTQSWQLAFVGGLVEQL